MGATFGDGIDITFVANANLNAVQYHFVQTTGSLAADVGDVEAGTGGCNPGVLGVLQNDPASGVSAAVRMIGSTQLYVNAAGSTIHFGRLLTCASDGHGELFDYTAAAGGSPVVSHAIALGHTTSDGAIIEAFVVPNMLMMSGS